MSTTYLEFVIHLDDKAAVDRLQKQTWLWTPVNSPFSFTNPLGGGSWAQVPARSPDWVGKVYGGPLRAAYQNWKGTSPAGPPLIVLTTNQSLQPNCITSPWITANGQTTNPIDKDQFTRKKGGFWSWITCWFTDCDEDFIWRGRFEYSPAAPVTTPGPGGPTPVAAILQRKWIDGFEHPLQGEGGSGGSAEAHTRAASRHTDGYGFMLRSSVGALRTHTCAENGIAASTETWERFYIRPRAYPTAKVPFWRCRGSISNSSGVQLCMESTGRISVNDTDGFDVMTPTGTTANAIPIDTWARIDLVFSFPKTGVFPTSAGSYFELWILGVLSLNVTALAASQAVQNHNGSEVGHGAGYDTRNLGLDIDDWMAAKVPDRDITKRTSNDWKNGSKVAPIEATALSGSSGLYTGNYRIGLQEPADDATIFFSTSTGGDVLALKTNAEKVIGGTPGAIGAAALVVACHSERSGTGNGSTGFSVNAAAPTYVASVDSAIRKWSSALYNPAGALAPVTMTPLEIFRKASATVTVEKVYTFAAAAELLGVFGNEDVVADSTGAKPVVVNNTGIHNAPYPRTAWAKNSDTPPVSPVAVIAGTYTGNDDGQDLVFQFPPTWLIIRDVTDGTDGVFWFSSLFSSHHLFRQEIESCGAVQILVDPDFEVVTGSPNDQMERYLVRIVGDQANSNAAGKTYSYTAFCDPGMRFTVNGSITWPRGATDRMTKLFRANFTPDASWFFREQILGSTNVEVYYKGRGHATNAGSKIDAAETATLVSFAKGIITTKSALHGGGAGSTAIGFAAWRRSDGSGDPGLPKVVQIYSYTGNGAGNRDIPFDVVSLVRPLWAMIVPHNAAAVYRDTEHTGTGSTRVPTTAVAANGIRGGDIDKILVGSDLNANGIVYDVFLIPGGTAACNNGWSCPGTFVPIPPIPPPGWGGCDPITLAPSTLPHGQVGVAYSGNISASGGLAPYVYAVTNGSLPAGLSLSSGGVISGTPTSPVTGSFTVRATDSGEDGCFGEQFYSISFNADTCPDVALAPSELPAAVVGTPYTASISATGGAAPYIFTISNGALPAGFTLSSTGVIAGTLASTAVSPFTVRATDINGCFGEMLYSLVPDDIGGGVGCVAASLDIVNRALSRIGITKPIVDMLTDRTPEATMARLHYTNDVDTVLRDFPWPFATKYAALVKVAGTTSARLNADWTFSYRQPNGCLFERRIVISRGAGIDPVPPPFQLSSDASGGLILTNQNNAVLEYTARPNCAALRGDSLFRDALTWRHALSLAPALTRMTDVAKNAEEQYKAAIELAREVLRPANPGAPAAAATVDLAVAAIAQNLSVVNLALVRIGASTIANLSTDQSREARAAALVFEEELRATLRELPWPFATGYTSLTKLSGPTPANPDWKFAYRQPSDSVLERRLVLERKGAVDPPPPPFAMTSDTTGGVILANVDPAVLEYTRRPDGAVLLADGLFRDAFAWRLAASLAPSLAQRRPEQVEQLGRGPRPMPTDEVGTDETPAANGIQLRAAAATAAWQMYANAIAKARAIHKPGVPGLPGDAPAGVDTCGSCQQANVAAVNRALVRIGSRTVRDLWTDPSREATAARLVFEDELRATLYDFPWPFATRYATLARLAGPLPPASPDWAYSYRTPDDNLFERRLVAPRGDAVDPTSPAFQLSSDATGGLILTNQADAVLEYTARPDGAVLRGDMLFRDALAWRLAAALAPSLGPVDPEATEQVGRGPDAPGEPPAGQKDNAERRRPDAAFCWQRYLDVLAKAQSVLKPGIPGLAPTAPTTDTSTAAQTANTSLVNRALAHLGAQTIVALATDQTRPGIAARLVFENELRDTLAELPWPFATTYATLVAATLPAPIAAAGEWTNAYRQPADCVFERRLVKDRKGAVDPTPPPFQLATDVDGGLILTNETTAVLEYTARIDGAVQRGDRRFREALMWRLAAVLAPSLAVGDADRTEQRGRTRDVPEDPDSKPAKRQTQRVDASYAWRMYRDTIAEARAVVAAGTPGPKPAAPTIDTSATAQLANTNVVNRALVRIGAQTIPALATDQSREATAARLIFEDELQSTLRDHPWAFASSYVTPTLVAGSTSTAVNADWQYSYRLAADVVFARRLVTAKKRAWEPTPGQFRLGKDATGTLIFVNDVAPIVEVTVRPEGAVAIADALFRDALAWRLAAALAPSLATVDPSKPEQQGRGPADPLARDREPRRISAAQRVGVARWAWDRYLEVLSQARTVDAREQQSDPVIGDADWITGRN